jgi:LmbE family N-acetylglucosaminyl deacetylase
MGTNTKRRPRPWLLVFACVGFSAASAQTTRGAVAAKQSLDRLRVVARVLMIAAHPDDERTQILAYCAQGRHYRTAYLSLTRGEGGQNLIGSEQGDLMGVIRTQELLAARHIDGAEQYFTRAVDFGFSKTVDETLSKWGRENVLADVVWNIRRFRPDVIILGFTGTPRDGHGHHQASAILGKEAFHAAADPQRFPEQLKYVGVWQAKRVLFPTASFFRFEQLESGPATRSSLDAGEYNPLLGLSYNEIAGISRSQHKSQGFGTGLTKGSTPSSLIVVDGDPVKNDFMDGIDTTWNRLPGGAAVDAALAEAQKMFDPAQPEKAVPALLKARTLIAAIDHPDARAKLVELDETIAVACGIWIDPVADRAMASLGSQVQIKVQAVNRSPAAASLVDVAFEGATGVPTVTGDKAEQTLSFNKVLSLPFSWMVPADHPYTQPLWLQKPKKNNLYVIDRQEDIGLAEGPPVLTARCRIRIADGEIVLRRAVDYRWVDRVRGELSRPFLIVPPAAVEISDTALLFPSARPKSIDVQVRANEAGVSGEVSLRAPAGWTVEPASRPFARCDSGQELELPFEVTPPAGAARAELQAIVKVGGREISSNMVTIKYDHIPPQAVFPPAKTPVARENISITAHKVGYVMGAGDEVPDALHQMGCDVSLLTEDDLARGDLGRFDAIVTGVRAWNVRADLRASHQRLYDYAASGGTVLVQYNVLEGPFLASNPEALKDIGPYPIKIGRERVTVEEAPIHFIKPDHRLLQYPNHITESDFADWIQERGLYFATEWDPHYETLIESSDPGEKPLPGGLLYAKVGKGTYVFTAYAFFRQLPAGVPGAFRLFANLLSAGKSGTP